MKKYSILSLLLAVLMLIFAALHCFATEYLPDSNVTAYGKIFYNGVNEVVDNSSQFDTHISNLSLFCENDKYIIRFTFDSDNYAIPTTMVSAKMNNANGDHYILCPDDKTVGDFEILKISYTLHANIHDLLPANIESMSDQSVLTILVSHNQDVYYWQAIVYPSNISAHSNVAELPCVNADSSEISNQFEYYFAGTNSSFEVNINSDDVMDVSEIDPSYFEIDFSNQPSVEANLSKASTSVMRASSDNPYRSYGIPNSAFTTQNDSWTWRNVGRNEDGTVYPWRYYRYTYSNYGSNNLYTSLVVLEVIEEMPEEYVAKKSTMYHILRPKPWFK